jgi:hypothetical protein
MNQAATNTVPAVITSSGTGQAEVLACLSKDKTCPDYFKQDGYGFLELPPSKIVWIDSCFSKPGPWNQTSDEVDASCPRPTVYRCKTLLARFLVF